MPDPHDSTSLYGMWVYEIFQDQKGNLWIGTELGLNLFQPLTGSFIHYTESDGLLGSAVLSILEDKNQNLWISTNKGLNKFNPQSKLFRNYDISDGLQGNEFNYTSSLLTHNGYMYFGGKNGFNMFFPDSISDNQFIPPVYFTDIKVLNQSLSARHDNKILSKHINFEKCIILAYNQNLLTIEFTALNYTNPQKN
jgi:hypothetical protein